MKLKRSEIRALLAKRYRAGFLIYRGPSRIDGKPIIAVVTLHSSNAKTGPMAQTWILRERVNPVRAVSLGLDGSICGYCPYRSGNGCYVNVGHAPLAVWRKFRAKGYPIATLAQLRTIGAGRKIRIGSYGDPSAVPVSVWRSLIAEADGRTGYTHAWSWIRNADSYRPFLMASVDSADEERTANALGWRTMRVKTKGEARSKGSMVCPASAEAGKRVQCFDCMACDGADSRRTLNVVIDAHGAKSKRVELYQLG